jgi:hypothetical protein
LGAAALPQDDASTLAAHGLLPAANNSWSSWSADSCEQLGVSEQLLLDTAIAAAGVASSGAAAAWQLLQAGAEAGAALGLWAPGGWGPAHKQHMQVARQQLQQLLNTSPAFRALAGVLIAQWQQQRVWQYSRAQLQATLSSRRVAAVRPLCAANVVQLLEGAAHPVAACLKGRGSPLELQQLSSLVLEVSPTYEERAAACEDMIREYKFYVPQARSTTPSVWCTTPDMATVRRAAEASFIGQQVRGFGVCVTGLRRGCEAAWHGSLLLTLLLFQ